jgi:hypothetical protein
MEDLEAWLVLNAFCATGDTFQPTLARDRRGEVRAGRWFPLHWDMDVSFFTVSRRPRWVLLQDPLRLALDPDEHPRLLLGRLLHRLLAEDPEFRTRLSRRRNRARARADAGLPCRAHRRLRARGRPPRARGPRVPHAAGRVLRPPARRSAPRVRRAPRRAGRGSVRVMRSGQLSRCPPDICPPRAPRREPQDRVGLLQSVE